MEGQDNPMPVGRDLEREKERDAYQLFDVSSV